MPNQEPWVVRVIVYGELDERIVHLAGCLQSIGIIVVHPADFKGLLFDIPAPVSVGDSRFWATDAAALLQCNGFEAVAIPAEVA